MMSPISRAMHGIALGGGDQFDSLLRQIAGASWASRLNAPARPSAACAGDKEIVARSPPQPLRLALGGEVFDVEGQRAAAGGHLDDSGSTGRPRRSGGGRGGPWAPWRPAAQMRQEAGRVVFTTTDESRSTAGRRRRPAPAEHPQGGGFMVWIKPAACG
jgi:hypothetical protein